MKNNAKILDVADKAGVSIATVSHVINKTRYVSPELIEIVEHAMKELGYSPANRRKKRTTTNTIGLIIPDNANPILAELTNHISDKLHAMGMTMIVCSTMYDVNKEIEFLNTFRTKMVDGIMIMPATDNLINGDNLLKSRIPVLILDREIRNADLDTVRIVDEDISMRTIDYLYNLGHRVFGYIDREYEQSHSIARIRGLETALEKYGLDLNYEYVVKAKGFCYSDGYEAAERLFKKPTHPSAVLCLNDILGIGVMKRLIDMGIKIPEDISVVGFGDIPVGEYLNPTLTTFKYPSEKIAEIACEIMVKKIKDPFYMSIENAVVELGDIIIRQSTGKASIR